jgi:1-deoxy-D-xylulose-5-phosphate synthase
MFDEAELSEVARELREYLIESVAGAGGHFGAGLGVVELTVALQPRPTVHRTSKPIQQP